MSTTSVLALAVAIGVIAGLRSMTAPAVVSWAAHREWLDLHHSPLAFLGSTAAAYVLTALAIAELVMDKLPKTPSRKTSGPLIGRLVLGGLSGAALCTAANESAAVGAALGGLGGIAGTFIGYELRTRLVKALKVPDFLIALLEDIVAIGGGLFLVSRF
jgi:uncharacterized membrane protein